MTAMVFDQWVFGGGTGTKRHAVKRTKGGLPNSHFVSALCGARGDSWGMLRATNDPFDPAAEADVCTTCARRWTARHAPQMPGWTKVCKSCDEDKSINQFHVDKRTRDNLSTRCLDCEEGAKRAVREAEAMLEREASRQRALGEAHEHHRARLAALTRWQAEPTLPTFTCGNGHVLTAVTGARMSELGWTRGVLWPVEQWECPCGLTDVPQEQWIAADDARRALDTLDKLRVAMAAQKRKD